MELSVFHVVALGAVVALAVLFLLVLFEPGLDYEIRGSLPPCETHESLGLIAALVDGPVLRRSRVEVLTGGAEFYERELEAIEGARGSIHLEAYIFHPSGIGDRFVRALAGRAGAGVKVRVVVDAIGSMETPSRYFDALRKAGGEIQWYQPVRWHTLKRFNNRTHRELLVVDGKTAFVGGAGIAAWWTEGSNGSPAWRDTMVRVTGPLAAALQTSFVENWLESKGEVLAERTDFPYCLAQDGEPAVGNAHGLAITSAPSAGKATRARILFQVLLASARQSVMINSPYFLPDPSVIRELARAVRRGVSVEVIVPGRLNNHPIARRASRRRYGDLLRSGVRLFEYRPGMMHAKVLIVDRVWSVVGSTNFDNRSFGLNDEVNLAVQDREVATRLERDFRADLARSQEVKIEDWERRPLGERVLAGMGALLERNQ